MSKRFVKYSMYLLILVFIMSGCDQAVSSNTYEPINNSTEAGKIEQLQGSTSTNTEVKNEIDNKDNSQSQVEGNNVEDKNLDPKEVKKNNKIIVIDPGHGGKTGSEKEKVSPDSNEMKPKNVSGATGIKSRTPEHVIALEVSIKLKDILEKEGYTVIMTRTSPEQTISNIERAEVGNKNNADLVIRIHADSSTSSTTKGASMLVPGEIGYAKSIAKISKQYGASIFKTLLKEVKMETRGVITRNDLAGFNWSKVPVVLIEMGFLSNSNEDMLLNSSEYQDKIALGLAKGIGAVLIEK